MVFRSRSVGGSSCASPILADADLKDLVVSSSLTPVLTHVVLLSVILLTDLRSTDAIGAQIGYLLPFCQSTPCFAFVRNEFSFFP